MVPKRRQIMGLEKFKFNWNRLKMSTSLIEKWKPGKLKTEKSFEKSLYEYLHDNLKVLQVTRQYAKGRIRADLAIEDKVFIELKRNLNTTSNYQRLIGQISDYKNWNGNVIIILTGKTDPNLKKQLIQYLKDEDLVEDLLIDTGIVVIEK